MKKISKILLMSILTIGILVTVGCGKTTQTTSSQETKETNSNKKDEVKLDKENAIPISYDNDDYRNILDLFDKNEIKAKSQYLNKTLKITGEVKKITKSNDGYIVVHVITKDNFYGANLYFKNTTENENKIMNLKIYDNSKGSSNTVRGEVVSVYGYFEECKNGQSVSTGDRMKITNCEFI
jgi:hypothetical protein